jgi:hypothetical protein
MMKRVRVSVEIAEMGDFEVKTNSPVSAEEWSIDLTADDDSAGVIMQSVVESVNGFRF